MAAGKFRRRNFVFVIAAVLAVAIAGWGWWRMVGRIDTDNPRVVAQGQALYLRHCAKCHGENLQGEADWRTRRPNGELPAPPHDASGHTWHHTDEQLFGIVKHGMARYAPPDAKTNMPAFVGVLSDAEIRAVLAYIQSVWPDEIRRRRHAQNR